MASNRHAQQIRICLTREYIRVFGSWVESEEAECTSSVMSTFFKNNCSSLKRIEDTYVKSLPKPTILQVLITWFFGNEEMYVRMSDSARKATFPLRFQLKNVTVFFEVFDPFFTFLEATKQVHGHLVMNDDIVELCNMSKELLEVFSQWSEEVLLTLEEAGISNHHQAVINQTLACDFGELGEFGKSPILWPSSFTKFRFLWKAMRINAVELFYRSILATTATNVDIFSFNSIQLMDRICEGGELFSQKFADFGKKMEEEEYNAKVAASTAAEKFSPASRLLKISIDLNNSMTRLADLTEEVSNLVLQSEDSSDKQNIQVEKYEQELWRSGEQVKASVEAYLALFTSYRIRKSKAATVVSSDQSESEPIIVSNVAEGTKQAEESEGDATFGDFGDDLNATVIHNQNLCSEDQIFLAVGRGGEGDECSLNNTADKPDVAVTVFKSVMLELSPVLSKVRTGMEQRERKAIADQKTNELDNNVFPKKDEPSETSDWMELEPSPASRRRRSSSLFTPGEAETLLSEEETTNPSRSPLGLKSEILRAFAMRRVPPASEEEYISNSSHYEQVE